MTALGCIKTKTDPVHNNQIQAIPNSASQGPYALYVSYKMLNLMLHCQSSYSKIYFLLISSYRNESKLFTIQTYYEPFSLKAFFVSLNVRFIHLLVTITSIFFLLFHTLAKYLHIVTFVIIKLCVFFFVYSE